MSRVFFGFSTASSLFLLTLVFGLYHTTAEKNTASNQHGYHDSTTREELVWKLLTRATEKRTQELREHEIRKQLLDKDPKKKKLFPKKKRLGRRSRKIDVKYDDDEFEGTFSFKSKEEDVVWLDDLPFIESIVCDKKGKRLTLKFSDEVPELPELDDLPVNVLVSPRYQDCIQLEKVNVKKKGETETQNSLALGHFKLKKLIKRLSNERSLSFVADPLPFFGKIDYGFNLTSLKPTNLLTHDMIEGRSVKRISTGNITSQYDVSFNRQVSNDYVVGTLGCNPCSVSYSVSWKISGTLSCSWLIFCSVISEANLNFGSLSADVLFNADARTVQPYSYPVVDEPDLYKYPIPGWSYSFAGMLDLGFFFSVGFRSFLFGQINAKAGYKLRSNNYRVYLKFENSRLLEQSASPLDMSESVLLPQIHGKLNVGFEVFPRMGFELDFFGMGFEAAAGLRGRLDAHGNMTLSSAGNQLCVGADISCALFYYLNDYDRSTFLPLLKKNVVDKCYSFRQTPLSIRG